ncbi:MAG: hypothetical protein NVSMB4_00610 [Acidimicrobiales bacterium]
MDISQRAAQPALPMTRSFPAEFEVRSPSNSTVEVEGYASTFNQPYSMFDTFGKYTESVRTGAFTKSLAERGVDVPFLIDHTGLPQARTTNGSLILREDDKGLLSVATLNTERSDTRDLVHAIKDGLMTEMSFGFRMVQEKWSADYDQREMIELNLNRGDVSAVKFGANPLTNIGVRAAFRSMRPAGLHRLAGEIRDGSQTLSPSARATLAAVLDLAAQADDAVDQIQPMLATLLGVADPDADDETSEMETKALALLDVMRRRHQADGEHRRTA